jgi:predicted O-methyltransferase YrrM
MNPEKYRRIEGWFDFDNIYKSAVLGITTDTAHFVEIGAWFGRSTCYMAECIKESGKNIKFDTVDTWKGTIASKSMVESYGGSIYDVFVENMQRAGVDGIVNPIKMPSHEAAALYEDESLDFVFVDGEHSYDGVSGDINFWLPKVRKGGVLAGHDYNHSADVRRAVNELLGEDKIKKNRSSWIYKND